MRLSVRLAALIVMTYVTGCAAYDPVAACEANCEAQQAGGCLPTALSCATLCEGSDVRYDTERSAAEELGCAGLYDRETNCENQGDRCDPTRCLTETTDLGVCLVTP